MGYKFKLKGGHVCMKVGLAGLATIGAITSATATAPKNPSPPSGPHCTLPAGWGAVTKDDPRYVVFGEVHGTAESPALVGDIACALAARGKRLLVGVELAADEDEALQRAWNGPHDRFADAVIAGMPDWKDHSGVTSRALLTLFVRLHALKTKGAAIDVVAFDGIKDEAQRAHFAGLSLQGPNEAAGAENIRVAAEAGDYDQVLVLVGNVHAQRRPYERYGQSFEPMAMRLARSGTLASLELVYGNGTAWGCRLRPGVTLANGPSDIKPGDMLCVAHSFGGRPGVSGGRRVGRWPTAWQTADDAAYDGYAWVGPAHVSPPAVDGASGKK